MIRQEFTATWLLRVRYVVDQLQCLGILQTCEVLKVGMPTRVTYTELKEVLGDNAVEAEKLFDGEPETALIAAILWAFEVRKPRALGRMACTYDSAPGVHTCGERGVVSTRYGVVLRGANLLKRKD